LSFIVLSLFRSDGTLQICIVAKLWSVRARCFNLYPLQFNWFSVFYACRFHHSAKPFLSRSQFLVSSSPEPADPDESLSVYSPKDHVFFFTDHCFRESVVRQWSFDPFVVIFLPQVALFLVIFFHLPAEIPGIFLDSLSSRLSIKAILAFGSSPDLVGRNR
jgi:hypothetical protein